MNLKKRTSNKCNDCKFVWFHSNLFLFQFVRRLFQGFLLLDMRTVVPNVLGNRNNKFQQKWIFLAKQLHLNFSQKKYSTALWWHFLDLQPQEIVLVSTKTIRCTYSCPIKNLDFSKVQKNRKISLISIPVIYSNSKSTF